MRPDETALPPNDAGWPDEVDRALTGDGSVADESVAARWIESHPGAPQFFAVLRHELDPLPAAAFDAAALFARIVGTDAEAPSTHSANADTTIAASHMNAAQSDGIVATDKQYLYKIARTVFDGLTGRTVAALFGKKDTELTPVEIERLRDLVKQSEPEKT